MGMLELQIALARLCLSRRFRADFREDADAAVRQLDARTTEEAASLKQLDLEAVGEFGDSLIVKRISMIRKWLPLSFTALDRHLSPAVVNRHLDRYTQEHVRDGDEYAGIWKLRDSARVRDYLRELVARGVIPLPAAADVIGFETESLRLTIDPDVAVSATMGRAPAAAAVALTDDSLVVCPLHASVQAYRHNLPLVLSLIAGECGIDDIPETPCRVLFVRGATEGQVETHTIGEGSHAILSACAVPTRVRDVVAALRATFGPRPGLEEAMRQEIGRLVALGALMAQP